jgi:hypothetical protein
MIAPKARLHRLLLCAVLAAALLVPRPAAGLHWPFDAPDPVPPRTSAQCRAAAGVRAFQGADQAKGAAARWLGLEGPVLTPPGGLTDVTTLETLALVRMGVHGEEHGIRGVSHAACCR